MPYVTVAAFFATIVAAVALAVVALVKYRALRLRYLPIVDVEAEVARQTRELARLNQEKGEVLAEDARRRGELGAQYQTAKGVYERLRTEIALLEENLEDISFGLYRPHYSFETPQQFKAELDRVYEQKKAAVRAGTAAHCPIAWTVNNSKREGARMTKQNMKVMLRAFNGEVDAAVAKVSWNNVTRMEERIRRAYESINDAGTANQITISQEYLDLALAELRLTHEHEAKKRDEQEEQRQIREQMREEERAQREFERAQQEAAAEEERYEKALAKAKADVEKAKGEEIEKVNAKVHELEQMLSEAHAKAERATSMAELTKSGHVYIISNIGSFGDEVFKIGMTRRLVPMERIQELGDASVPFAFDVHAMVYSEDAPGLENAFHRQFAGRRVNLVNMRKEYFRVGLAEIEAFALSQGVDIQLTKLAEAREYRETLAIMKQKEAAQASQPGDSNAITLPDQLFPAA